MPFNKVILLGNVTRNPEVRFIPGKDTAVAKFGLAVNEKRKDRDDTCFIDVVAFGKLAEICGEYVSKGMPLLIEGKLKYSSWEADGQKRSKHEIMAENIQFIGKRESQQEDSYNGGDINEEDLPF